MLFGLETKYLQILNLILLIDKVDESDLGKDINKIKGLLRSEGKIFSS